MNLQGEESILSPELLQELGIDNESDALRVSGPKKRQRKEKYGDLVSAARDTTNDDEPTTKNNVSQEVLLEAKKLSKRAQKRIAQIQQRKDKEARQSEYIRVIKENEISDSQRKMLASTTSVGQIKTLRQLLASLYRKQQAGLPLTAEEMELLFKQKGHANVDCGGDLSFRLDMGPDSSAVIDAVDGRVQKHAISEVHRGSGSDGSDVGRNFGRNVGRNGYKPHSASSKAGEADDDKHHQFFTSEDDSATRDGGLLFSFDKLAGAHFLASGAGGLQQQMRKKKRKQAHNQSADCPEMASSSVIDGSRSKQQLIETEQTVNPHSSNVAAAEVQVEIGGQLAGKQQLIETEQTVNPHSSNVAAAEVQVEMGGQLAGKLQLDSSAVHYAKPSEEVAQGATTHTTISSSSTSSSSTSSSNLSSNSNSNSLATTGSSLLAQIKQLQQMKTIRLGTVSAQAPSGVAEGVDGNGSRGISNLPDSQDAAVAYVPHLTTTPVDNAGLIMARQPVVELQTQDGYILAKAPPPSSKDGSADRQGAVPVPGRPADVRAARLSLPVCAMEQEVVEAVRAHDAVILCGETGSGKSTQVPQFLYEAGFAHGGQLIGITQPRRVAVTSTAQRVLYEMTGLKDFASSSNSTTTSATLDTQDGSADAQAPASSKNSKKKKKKDVKISQQQQLVGYQIRFDSSTVGPQTCIKFMTDGILLREVAQDLLLRRYSCILLDEAHERGTNSDVLLGLLSRVLPLRRRCFEQEQARWLQLSPQERERFAPPLPPLKLVIMSATLRVRDFQSPVLFPPHLFNATSTDLSPLSSLLPEGSEGVQEGPYPYPPVVRVDARQHPVTTHFSRRTELRHYLREARRKVAQIHRRLPDGGVLLFLTGRMEILRTCRKLRRTLNKRAVPSSGGGTGADKRGIRAHVEESLTTEAATNSSQEEQHEVEGPLGLELGSSAEELMELMEGSDSDEDHDDDDNSCDGSDIDSDIDDSSNVDGDGSVGGGIEEAPNRSSADKSRGEEEEGEDGKKGGDDDDDDSEEEEEEQQQQQEGGREVKMDASMESEEDDAPISRDRLLRQAVGDAVGEVADLVKQQEQKKQLKKQADADDHTRGGRNMISLAGESGGDVGREGKEKSKEEEEEEGGDVEESPLRAWVLPLFALMPPQEQARVFRPPPPGHRLVVVATDVAETSITIPGIRYVVDCGRHKQKVTHSAQAPASASAVAQGQGKVALRDTATALPQAPPSYEEANDASDVLGPVSGTAGAGAGIAKYEVQWISQASAQQRQGRAGRTGPGHCYRLYSANFFHQHMLPFQAPEITRTPLEELILQMKALGIERVERFPFPTPPPRASIRHAVTLLYRLAALGRTSTSTALPIYRGLNVSQEHQQLQPGQGDALRRQLLQAMRQRQWERDNRPLTALGGLLARFPINPRYGKMLIMAHRAAAGDVLGDLLAAAGDASGGAGVPGTMRSAVRKRYILLAHCVTLVAALAERPPFTSPQSRGCSGHTARRRNSSKKDGDDEVEKDDEEEDDDDDDEDEEEKEGTAYSLSHHKDGDAMARLRAFGAFTFIQARQQQQQCKTNKTSKKSRPSKSALWTTTDAGGGGSGDADGASGGQDVERFCAAQGLHLPTLRRVADLRQQLQQICATVLLTPEAQRLHLSHSSRPNQQQQQQLQEQEHQRGVGVPKVIREVLLEALDVPLAPPSEQQEQALRQLVLCGFCDSVARRVPLGVVKEGSRRRRLTAFFSCNPALQTQLLYLHPAGSLYRTDPTAPLPEFVVYSSLQRSDRGDTTYMHCVTAVSPAWLPAVAADCPLLRWSAPLPSPAPQYDPAVDAVTCLVVPRFGAQRWELPPVRRSLAECITYSGSGGSRGGSSGNGGDSDDDGDDEPAAGERASIPSPISNAPVGFRKEDEVFRWFGRLLLEGYVLYDIDGNGRKLDSNGKRTIGEKGMPSCILCKQKLRDGNSAVALTQMQPTPQVASLLRQLVKNGISSRGSLRRALTRNPSAGGVSAARAGMGNRALLSEELAAFLRASERSCFRKAWQLAVATGSI